jgi:O-antigen/teichoic acid export membrane protein
MLKRIGQAFLAFFFGQVLGLASNILLVPLFLHAWSPAKYGEWLTLYSAVAYLSGLDLGVQMYVINRLTQAYARQDMDEYHAVQHTAFAFYTVLAVLGSLAVAAFAILAPIARWFNLVQTDRTVIVTVIIVLAVQYLFQLHGSILVSAYRTTGNLAFSQWMWNFVRGLTLALTVISLLVWPRFEVVAMMQLAGWLIVEALTIWHVRVRFPELIPSFRHARWDLVGGILRPSMMFGMILLSTMLILQGSALLVAGVLGATAVAIFITTRTLANAIRQLVSLFANSSWTALTRLEAVDDRARLRVAFRLLLVLTTAACLAVSASLWFEGSSVILFWTSGKLQPDTPLLRWLLCYLILQTPWITAATITCATNNHRVTSNSYLFSAVGGLLLAAALIHRMGLVALPIGLILGELLACYHFVIRDSCRVVGENYGAFARRFWTSMCVVTAMAMLATGAVHRAPIGNLERWVLSGIASTIAVALGTWLVWLTSEDRLFIRAKLALGIRHFSERSQVPAQTNA